MAAVAARYCKNCGEKITSADRFCFKCGEAQSTILSILKQLIVVLKTKKTTKNDGKIQNKKIERNCSQFLFRKFFFLKIL